MRQKQDKNTPYKLNGQIILPVYFQLSVNNLQLILTLTSSLGFFLTFYRRLLIVFSFTNLGDNAVLCAASLEAFKSGIQGFVFSNTNFSHFIPSLCTAAEVLYIRLLAE